MQITSEESSQVPYWHSTLWGSIK